MECVFLLAGGCSLRAVLFQCRTKLNSFRIETSRQVTKTHIPLKEPPYVNQQGGNPLNDDRRKAPEPYADHAWLVMISDKGAAVWCSDKVMKACGKTLRQLTRGVLPWVLTGLTTFGGMAGVVNWLRQQPETPATSPTEEIAPQRKGD